MGAPVDAALAILNGTFGDYLGTTGNDLATPMHFIHQAKPLPLEPEALTHFFADSSPSLVVLVHGLMCTENVWHFRKAADSCEFRDYGTMLAADLGYTPLYLRYNSGLAIADNGVALARILEELVCASPVAIEKILLISHSLGGLVVRSAAECAVSTSLRWRSLVRRVIFIDTPHHGSPLERLGRSTVGMLRAINSPITELIADIGDLRSEGIKNLGDDHASPRHASAAFPSEVEQCIIAAGPPSDRPLTAAARGLLVPVESATAHRADVSHRIRIFPRLGHLELARHPDVYTQIRSWCEEES